MATQIDPKELDLQEQFVRIRHIVAQIDRTYDEREKMIAEGRKMIDERATLQAQAVKLTIEARWYIPLATAAGASGLTLASVAVAKLFL